MATRTDSTFDGFGRVSRTAGTIFRYLLLAATLFGLVVMTILLVYVANDAFQPLTADTGWHATFLATLLVPTLAVAAYLYRESAAALRSGAYTVGLIVVSALFSGGVGMLFVDIVAPVEWFAVVVALVAPTAAVLAVVSRDHRLSFTAQFATAVVAFYVSLFGVPGPLGTVAGLPAVVPSVLDGILYAPYALDSWLIVTLTVGGPVAFLGGRFVAGDRGERVRNLVAGGVLAGVVVAAFLGPTVGVEPMPAAVVAAVGIAPPVVYAAGVAANREQERPGVLLPVVAVAGTAAGVVLTDAFGFAGPNSWVTWAFLTNPHSRFAEQAGFYPAIGGSILLMVAVAVLAFPVGVGAAVYLEEYAPNNRFKRLVDVNISNLAGVPSVVYGLLGLGIFVTYLGQAPGTILVGGATLGLLILPIVIISAREAIRSVPDDLRDASYGMGATRWQTVKNVVLPRSFSGILTGTILALGRAIGETAPLIMIGAPNVKFAIPTGFGEAASAMPLQVYAWSSLYAGEEFYQKVVPAGVVVLVAVLLAMNSIAIVLRNKYQSQD
jgi:phosphate transport system permease protein